ncbi:MAG: molecular chaperone HtpG [Akkermansiaceae bacterium]|jgi:TNF receptor-associated protein 1|nr:molecular chaperone HtpG [Akkermansiaceae bacterium]
MSEEESNKHHFQAEVQQLLDIVINSLYTDKEIFIRELVSNAADALEKLRHTQLTQKSVLDPELELAINITTDEEKKTIKITDHGIGMNRDELTQNLGTIAHSGSKKFINSLSDSDQKETSLIGQFGVGFYSAFMVSNDVKVFTRSWEKDSQPLSWASDGKSGYEIQEEKEQKRGTSILISLTDDHEEFSKEDRVKDILQSYSSFVPFPVLLNGERINTVEAIWMKPKSEITDEDYTEFYKFTAKAFDEPIYRMHFSADAPLMINSLVFVPKENPEKLGFGQVDPGVSLYCNKVLIDGTPKGLLPDWLRFLKGVIDSEDLPLNISRESMQDSALIKKLNRLITKRFIKFLERESNANNEIYETFYNQFRNFIKEGVITDTDHRDNLANLLRFETSIEEPGNLSSLDQYVTRMKEGQDKIYFQIAQDRSSIESAPYLEAFKARGLEVLFLYEAIDEYLVGQLTSFSEKELVSINRADLELDDIETEGDSLDEELASELCEWIKETLGERIAEVRSSKRLVDSPAAALTPGGSMSPQMKQMMQQMNPDFSQSQSVEIEINPRHDLIKKLHEVRQSRPDLAPMIAEQIVDNALLSAGLLDESKNMVTRVYDIMLKSLD